jgi:hypothetical protein
MVIRFPLRQKAREIRLESHPSGLNRTPLSDDRRLSEREIVHRERMLEHLQRIETRTP